MPFTLFKFPTLFGKKQSSYKLDRADILPIKLDLDAEIDPVILSHSKPSFTTFGYNSEYALEDILRSGLYSEDTEQEVQWKGARKQRPRNPFQSSERPSSRQVEDGPGAEDEEEEEFQQLYADLQRSGASSECAGGSGQFEEIYENLVVGPSSSCLPPEIYSLHMESHTQRMGILSRYVETSNYSLDEDTGSVWSQEVQQRDNNIAFNFNWKQDPDEDLSWANFEPAAAAAAPATAVTSACPRLNFIPSRETTVASVQQEEEEEVYSVPRNLAPVLWPAQGNGGGMNGSESECESLDSGLETTSNSQLEAEGEGGHADPDTEEEEERHGAGDTGDLSDFSSEGIYENTPMKSGAMPAPSTAPAVLGKYEFGLGQEIRGEDSEQEQEEEEGDTRGQEAVSFQDLDNFERVPAGEVKRSWGVRRESSAVSPVERSVNPTEEVIAREIRELKEREEELARRQREQSQEPDTDTEEEEEVREDTSVKTSSSTVNMAEVKPANNSSKFNPSLYGPVILPPRARPGLMQSFLNNGGKVAAFKPPARDTVVTLRKPQVFKSVPKVSPPAAVAAVSRPSQGQVLDKIQAELAETRRREEELRRQRQPRDSGGQHSLDTGDLDTGEGEEEEDSPPSLVCTRGKSALISVWENRIQCEKAA